ncbi:hypothetical protein ABM428_04680 [Sulfitobacter sp. TCYB15]|uniref:Uncharacterized protein n=1 Tax=Sulfitobacter sp. TCYB15 TaxID=3229275 RepID=A0AAU8C627_9RHOB|nr:hypothetical protein [Sulfitobacter pontiacus]
MIELLEPMLGSTDQLALWGAITGSIGTTTGILSLYLRYKQQKRDQANLTCEAVFDHEFYQNSAKPRYHITVRSVGRRPVTVDHVQYRMGPLEFPKRLQRWYKWQKKEWLHAVEPSTVANLTEGTKVKLPIDPQRVGLKYVYKVKVVDQTGRMWPVVWPSQKRLSTITHHKSLDDQSDGNTKRKYTLHGMEFQDKFRLMLLWNPEDGKLNSMTGRTFTFDSMKKYSEKLARLNDVEIPSFMNDGNRDF